MLLFIDGNQVGEQHLIINRAMKIVFEKIYKNHNSYFVGDKKHFSSINENLKSRYIHGLWVRNTDNLFLKILSEIYNFFILLLFFLIKKPNVIIFLSSYPICHFLLRVFSFLLYFDCKVYVVIHGELRYLYSKECSILKPSGWMKKAFSFVGKNISNKFRYIVLGEQVYIGKDLKKENVIKINHPCLFKNNKKLIKDRIKNITSIGVASKSKNSHVFFEIAEALKNSNYLFSIAGKVDSTIAYDELSNVSADFSGRFLSSRELDLKLKNSDLSIFVYTDDYCDVASGAILEAINYEIPVYCLRNKYFDFLKDKGINFFYDFNSKSELVNALKESSYLNFNPDFKMAKKLYSIESAINIIINYEKTKE